MKTYALFLYKLLNKVIIQLQEKTLRNSRVIGLPFHLVLEPGNVCNLRCPLCPTPFREKRIPKGFISLDRAKNIIDQFPALVHLNLSLWGEPLLNKDLFDIIAYAQEKGIEVLIQSNLNILDKASAVKLIRSNLHTLQISLDGASQETYERYRVNGTFETVIENINILLDVQQQEDNYSTDIIWKMVVNRYNEHEVEKAKAWAHELGVEFKIVEIYSPDHLADKWKPRENVRESSLVHTDIVEKCYSLWQVATVNFNGDVLPCCSEFSREDAIGNVFEAPFKKIWNNEKYVALRKANKETLNCPACHVDKDTNWYKLWKG